MVSPNELLKKRVEAVLDMALTTITSLAQTFTSSRPVSNEGTSKGKKEIPQDSSAPQDSPQVDHSISVAIDKMATPATVHYVDMQPKSAADDQAVDTDESDDEEILQVHN